VELIWSGSSLLEKKSMETPGEKNPKILKSGTKDQMLRRGWRGNDGSSRWRGRRRRELAALAGCCAGLRRFAAGAAGVRRMRRTASEL